MEVVGSGIPTVVLDPVQLGEPRHGGVIKANTPISLMSIPSWCPHVEVDVHSIVHVGDLIHRGPLVDNALIVNEQVDIVGGPLNLVLVPISVIHRIVREH